MKTLTDATRARLAADVTTRAICWRVTRRDGHRLGFTDHDRVLVFEGTEFRPELGFDTTAATQEADLATGTAEIAGILASESLTEDALSAGVWDGAEVESFVVDWRDPDHRILMRRAVIGEVTRSGDAFRAELRSLAHLFDQAQGRVFSHLCDANLGDARCGVDLEGGGYRLTGTILTGSTRDTLRVAGVASADPDWFSAGRVEVMDGAAAGLTREIASDRRETEARVLSLLEPLPAALELSAMVRLETGCDKRFATCREKFINTMNFQGFPHMPGVDFVLAYPSRGEARNDGGRLVE